MSESRGMKADRLIREGKTVAEAARIAGVSQFWLSLRVNRSRIGVVI